MTTIGLAMSPATTDHRKAVTVYCGSSPRPDRAYFEAAERLGAALACGGFTLVYGGGAMGLMGAVADSVHRHGGHVHGIITEKLAGLELARETCDELEIVPTMRQRKARMEELAHAFVTLPGGIGTYEELFEMLVARNLKDHEKTLVVVNINGYFRSFLDLLQRGVDEGFIDPNVIRLIDVVETPEQAVELLARL